MPTYEYRCPDGHDFEHFFLKMSQAASELPCPTCGKAGARRISAGGVLLFKGSGFYITDYGKDGKKDQRAPAAGAAGRETPAKGDGGKGDGGKGDGGKGDGGKGESGAKSDGAKSDRRGEERSGATDTGAKRGTKDRPVAAPTPKSGGKE